jgi:hypothetical protein
MRMCCKSHYTAGVHVLQNRLRLPQAGERLL